MQGITQWYITSGMYAGQAMAAIKRLCIWYVDDEHGTRHDLKSKTVKQQDICNGTWSLRHAQGYTR